MNSFETDILVPMSRIDLFFNEETGQYKFCEINTDGTSSMLEDKILNEALNLSVAYKKFIKDYNVTSFELFDAWVNEFILYYDRFKNIYNKPDKPNILITDFLEKGITAEFKVFKDYFINRGYNSEICDIRDLVYKDDNLYTTYIDENTNEKKLGMKVDAIYRRAVTSDIMNNYDLVLDFIKAVKNKKVCLIGDFHTQIIHNKIIFYVLHSDLIKKYLTKEESIFIKNHIPWTFILNDKNINESDNVYQSILNNKNDYILIVEHLYIKLYF